MDLACRPSVSRTTRLPAFLRRLFNKCDQDPQGKDTHVTWWEIMVVLCRTAIRTKTGPTPTTRQLKRWWTAGNTQTGHLPCQCVRHHPEGPPSDIKRNEENGGYELSQKNSLQNTSRAYAALRTHAKKQVVPKGKAGYAQRKSWQT